jgi:DNA-binding transcriptional LysR family regulator
MTLEQLRIFSAVAERQHVTRAAEALNLAQSAVSASVAALEGQYRTKLFHRVGRGIELTEAGALFLEEARAVLARAHGAELLLADLGGLMRGTLTVAASQTVASYWLPRHLVAFRARHPAIEIALRIRNSAEVADAVRAGEAALGFVEGPLDDPALETIMVAQDQLVIVVAPDHPWASAPPDAAGLAGTGWASREVGSGTRAEFEAALGALGIAVADLPIAIELPGNEAVRAAVEAGAGAAALSASVVAGSLEAGLLHHVPFPLPARPFRLVRHRERHRSKAADAMVSILGVAAG